MANSTNPRGRAASGLAKTDSERVKRSLETLQRDGGRQISVRLNAKALLALETIIKEDRCESITEAVNQTLIIEAKRRSANRQKGPPTPKASPMGDWSKGHSEEYHCVKCPDRVTKKVADYCIAHPELFGGKIYCFDCQKSLSP